MLDGQASRVERLNILKHDTNSTMTDIWIVCFLDDADSTNIGYAYFHLKFFSTILDYFVNPFFAPVGTHLI